MSERKEILISGFGGQGVVRLGQILSLASVYQGTYATMLISHGTETRGGYVRSQVVISDAPVDSPIVENPDYFCALSKAAYNRFNNLVKNGTIIYDPGYVERDNNLTAKHISVNAREIAANELGKEIFANIIVLGVLGNLMSDILDKKNIFKAMLERISRFQEENKKALEIGYDLA
ncbi:2-oxoacid:acceptor oxidoreductase family protein [Clostridium luticellarii]|uniref:2-oxoglutarate ferredoxin oxidoreductase subunit gamma n=1 Tax=Clostridium luticellarii TaxID=1691940 RepID=A0A2T0BCV2_9CLOT|nr:2-oxoacid:acceptor oxidoreductase family protein [Clostridium luticellarii]PRR81730.1 2-oxoglutarate ferredoxin oxidoreductase subunit gamma [Clostridium luticellarii]